MLPREKRRTVKALRPTFCELRCVFAVDDRPNIHPATSAVESSNHLLVNSVSLGLMTTPTNSLLLPVFRARSTTAVGVVGPSVRAALIRRVPSLAIAIGALLSLGDERRDRPSGGHGSPP
jgi:hypothetical protein